MCCQAAHHVQLPVGDSKMEGCACPVVLCDEVGVNCHDFGQQLGITQPGGEVEAAVAAAVVSATGSAVGLPS